MKQEVPPSSVPACSPFYIPGSPVLVLLRISEVLYIRELEGCEVVHYVSEQ